jgi:MYXO-CTERM domain-containing protein
MKTHARRNHAASIPTSRWLAYAAAGAATALTGVSTAEAEIHYSGRIEAKFGPDDDKVATFLLDQPGDVIRFGHYGLLNSAYAFFEIEALSRAAFAGYSLPEYAFPFRLKSPDRYLSEAQFVGFYSHGTLYDDGGRGYGRWGAKGGGFVGFRFDSGAGPQYGWARVRMGGDRASFILVDYAYGDPGEPVKPGQTSSSTTSAPSEGSLGFLAAGAAGVVLWRQRRWRG